MTDEPNLNFNNTSKKAKKASDPPLGENDSIEATCYLG
jgi:hypothetical protein